MLDESPLARGYAQLCGIATGLDVIGDRWSVLVIRDLLLGPLRFGDLANGLPGIGTNTLTTRLKLLEAMNVVARKTVALPDRGTVYELTSYGRELEPILMALGRWGAKSMGRLPENTRSRSRWLVAAMLAFHDPTAEVDRPTTWALVLSDGTFSVHAERNQVSIRAGTPERPDIIVNTSDDTLHRLLTGQLSAKDAIADGAAELTGGPDALPTLLSLFQLPPVNAGPLDS
jgi:DNA-binding HxlR family transcriptional regulator